MRFATACALSYLVFSGDVFAANDEVDDHRYTDAILFGFSEPDRALLQQSLEDMPVPTAQVVPHYLALADETMEACDLARVLASLRQTPYEHWKLVRDYTQQFLINGIIGADKAAMIEAAASLCATLTYDAVAMTEFKTRYDAFMPLVMTNFKQADHLTWLAQTMQAGGAVQPGDEYAGLLTLRDIGSAHSRVFQSLVALYASTVPVDQRDGSMSFCCYLFPFIDDHLHMSRVDIRPLSKLH